MSAVKYAVFPVAGLGTRFLPATKAVAKELLPVVDRPVIQYAVAECEAAGIEQLVLVTSRLKNSLIDHFEPDEALEQQLIRSGKEELLKTVQGILPAGMGLINVRQSQPHGLGHAVLCARDIVGEEPFAVVLPDDLLVPGSGTVSPALRDMVNCYDQSGQSVVAVEQVAREQVSSYGIVDPAESTENRSFRIRGMVEKPAPSKAPSRFGIVGRYVLQAAVFEHLEQLQRTCSGDAELQLTDAIHHLTPQVIAWRLQCRRYDCGSKAGFLQANLAAAAKDPDLAAELRRFLTQKLKDPGE